MKKFKSNLTEYWEKQINIELFDVAKFRKDVYFYFEMYKVGAVTLFCKNNEMSRATFWRTVTGKTTIVTKVHSKICEAMKKELKYYLKEK